ncbi:MAG: DUF885 domain-containing protein [Hellea sp.]|nr:DUF885 domain-containing protein [Hellea sp.]
MRKILLATTAFLLMTGCSADQKTNADSGMSSAGAAENESKSTVTKAATSDEDINAKIDAWFEASFMEAIFRSPMFLAQIGIKQRMDEWDETSREAALEDVAYYKAGLAELTSTFDRDQLDESHQLSYDLMVRFLEQQIEDDKWWEYGYPFNQMFGVHSMVPTFMKNQHPVDNVDDAKAYIARLNGVPEFLGGVTANSESSANKGILPPRFVYDHVLRDAANIITGAPFDDSSDPSVLLDDFTVKVGKLDIGDDEKQTLIDDAKTALTDSVKPAYLEFIAVMESQQAKATTDDGAWKLPNGAEYYAHRLNRMTTTNMSAEEIHQLGLDEVERIHGEMRAIMKQVGYEGTLQDFFVHLKTDPKYVYEDSDAGRAAYIKDAADLIDTMEAELGDYFSMTPKAKLEVRAVEAFREKSAGKAFYNRPAMDGSRPGIYYANLYKITDMPKYQMEALAYHEGIPGHHMQFAVTQELDIPKFQRFGSATAHSEGWGLYSEYLPKEMGFYEDPYSDFGRLSMELWRAARLVVDTGLHHKKWTREEAIDYLTTNTPNPENDCVKAIERYIVMPGQATAYKIGMNKILDLRTMSKEKLGDKFDIKEYHDVVLGAGPVPLDILERRVNAWIDSK